MSSDPVTSPPQLIRVALDGEFMAVWRRWRWSMAFRPFFIPLIVSLIVGVLLTLAFWGPWGVLAGGFVFAIASAASGVHFLTDRADLHPLRAELEAVFRAGGTPREAVLLLMKRKPRSPLHVLTHELTRAGATLGLCNHAICFTRPEDLPEIVPFEVSFEIRPLDECAPGFDELQAAVAPTPKPVPGSHRERAFHLPRWMQRNSAMWSRHSGIQAALTGGLAALVSSLTLGPGWSGLGTAVVALVVALLVPIRTLSSRGRRWHVVPGAIIVRRNQPFHAAAENAVYDRRRSVLYAISHRNRSWTLVVANAETVVQTAATRAEAEFALRAFLSPLTPPDVEALGDFR